MNPLLFVTLALAVSACVGGCGVGGSVPGASPLDAVHSLDSERYLGRWYEIARYPNSFQRGLVGVTADYSRRPDGTIQVVNRGRVGTLDGREKSARGKAWIPDLSESGRLKVRFFWPFTGDYWVIALDDDYRWAVVGEPRRRFLWILSRTPHLNEPTDVMIRERIARLGYDPSLLERTEQGGHPE